MENKIFTATADRVGEENRGGIDLKFIGTSEIIDPTVKFLAGLARMNPPLLSLM